MQTEKVIAVEKSREYSAAINRAKAHIHWALDKMIKHHNCTCHRCKVSMCKATNFRVEMEAIQAKANKYTIAANRVGLKVNK